MKRCAKQAGQILHCPKGNQFSAKEHEIQRGKRDMQYYAEFFMQYLVGLYISCYILEILFTFLTVQNLQQEERNTDQDSSVYCLSLSLSLSLFLWTGGWSAIFGKFYFAHRKTVQLIKHRSGKKLEESLQKKNKYIHEKKVLQGCQIQSIKNVYF